jgi:hypothetical protein
MTERFLSGDMDDEFERLVAIPVSEAVTAPNFSRRTNAGGVVTPMGGGMLRYHWGEFFVDVTARGLISVRLTDWLSKYALAIHGDNSVFGRFARLNDLTLLPIENEDLIEAGETLVHLPTFRNSRKRRYGYQWDRAVEGKLFDDAWEQMANDGVDQAYIEDGLLGYTAKKAVNLGFETASKILMEASNIILGDKAELSELTEDQKQAAFLNDGELTVRILYYEFLTGEGQQQREFDISHQIVRDVLEGDIANEVSEQLRLLIDARIREMNRNGEIAAEGQPIDFGKVESGYSFTPGDASFLESAKKHIKAGVQNYYDRPINFFLGGCTYVLDSADVIPTSVGPEYGVTLTNDSTLKSFLVHAKDVSNVSRISEEEMLQLGKEIKVPYSNIRQILRFHIRPAEPGVVDKLRQFLSGQL